MIKVGPFLSHKEAPRDVSWFKISAAEWLKEDIRKDINHLSSSSQVPLKDPSLEVECSWLDSPIIDGFASLTPISQYRVICVPSICILDLEPAQMRNSTENPQSISQVTGNNRNASRLRCSPKFSGERIRVYMNTSNTYYRNKLTLPLKCLTDHWHTYLVDLCD